MMPLTLPNNPRVLVVALRRLGDVLLTTPLIRSIKRAYPAAAIEALVFAGTEGILSGNPDLADVIAMPQRPSAGENLALIRRLARRYDLALSTQTGDRPTTLAWIAGRQSAGPLEPKGFSATVKRLALSRSYIADRQQHRVLHVLRLAELLGIPALAEIVCPAGEVQRSLIPAQPFAVVHAAPMFTYKRWTMDGWRALAAALRQRGLAIVTSGSVAVQRVLSPAGSLESSQASWKTVSSHNHVTLARATVDYGPQAWGTKMDVHISGIPAGTACQVWVVNSRGQETAAGGWTVSRDHQDVWYPASASLPTSDVRGFEISAGGKDLVTVPAA